METRFVAKTMSTNIVVIFSVSSACTTFQIRENSQGKYHRFMTEILLILHKTLLNQSKLVMDSRTSFLSLVHKKTLPIYVFYNCGQCNQSHSPLDMNRWYGDKHLGQDSTHMCRCIPSRKFHHCILLESNSLINCRDLSPPF